MPFCWTVNPSLIEVFSEIVYYCRFEKKVFNPFMKFPVFVYLGLYRVVSWYFCDIEYHKSPSLYGMINCLYNGEIREHEAIVFVTLSWSLEVRALSKISVHSV